MPMTEANKTHESYLIETLSVLMSYRKYNTIILDCLSKLRIMDLLRCDTMTNGVKKNPVTLMKVWLKSRPS